MKTPIKQETTPVPPTYYAMTMPGLESIAFGEIRQHCPDAVKVKFARGIVSFTTNAAAETLLELRTTEDVFVQLVRIDHLGRTQDALRVLHSATAGSDIIGALSQWRRTHNNQLASSWRVVSQKEGQHDFRRIDAGQSVAAALKARLPQKMRFARDEAEAEFWLWLGGSEALIGLRLSDATMRHRTYKHEHLPASLRPTVAATMVRLADPHDDDIVIDPLCGAGTLLIERGLAGEFDRLIGGDIEEDAVVLARRNARHAGVGVSWHVWDARTIPLDAGSVTCVISNLPFGKQIAQHEDIGELYHVLASEFARLLRSGGVSVTLTSEEQLWDTILRAGGWRVERKLGLVVLGQRATIFVARRP